MEKLFSQYSRKELTKRRVDENTVTLSICLDLVINALSLPSP